MTAPRQVFVHCRTVPHGDGFDILGAYENPKDAYVTAGSWQGSLVRATSYHPRSEGDIHERTAEALGAELGVFGGMKIIERARRTQEGRRIDALSRAIQAEGYRIVDNLDDGSSVRLECVGEDFGGSRLINHPAGGWILAHPEHPARWIKPDGTIEVIKP